MAVPKKIKSRSARGLSSNRAAIVIATAVPLIIVIALFAAYTSPAGGVQAGATDHAPAYKNADFAVLAVQVYPTGGFVLPARWGHVPALLAASGALNVSFIAAAFRAQGQPLTSGELALLNGSVDGNVTLNSTTAYFALYVLWALGINNNNSAITDGPTMDYGGSPYDLASTGGYGPLGKLSLGALPIIQLNSSQQEIVDYVASTTYRPCCDNPAMFPDCNHGAAQLGLIELMTSQGSNSSEIYSALKDFNSFYYPQQYLNISILFNVTQGEAWNEAPAQEVVGYNLSSASGTSTVSLAVSKYVQAAGASAVSAGSQVSACGAGQ